MTRKVFSKAIASVLVAAMCLAAVFTGAVSADTPRTANCTVTGMSYNQGEKGSYVDAEVTFESDTDFVAGSFDVTAAGLSLADCSVGYYDNGVQPNVKLNVSNKRVVFYGFTATDNATISAYEKLRLVLHFTIDGKALSAAAAGDSWNVTVSNIDITNADEDTYTTAAASTTSTTPIHIHSFTEAPQTNGRITTTGCSLCDAVKTEVDDITGLGQNELVPDPEDPIKKNKANVTFDVNGDTVLNALLPVADVDAYDTVYFVYHYTVSDENGDNVVKTETSVQAGTVGAGAYYQFPCGRNGGIGRLSRDVKGNFIAVAKDGTTVTISREWTYSIKKYAEDVIAGEFAAAHKNYAKALLDYGYYTCVALGSSESSKYNTSLTAGLVHASLPTKKAAERLGTTDSNWSLASGLSVTTGFKPKMNIVFNAATISNMDVVTFQVSSDGKVVYYKEVATSLLAENSNTFVLSDIPTKYLVNDIIIGAKKSGVESSQKISYSYGKYAKKKAGDATEGPVFQALMDWSYYLSLAY